MTTPFWQTDAPELFRDFGLPLEASDGTCTVAILDDEDFIERASDGYDVQVRETVLRIVAGSLADDQVAVGSRLVYDGTTTFEVRVPPRRESDGVILMLIVTRVPT